MSDDPRFGLIYVHLDGDRLTTDDPARKGPEAHWAEAIEHMVWAEQLGFDSIWLPEHHFAVPSPVTLAAAVAVRTTKVRISHNVTLAPLYHPVRLAEEAAMVSVLSNGRYDMGTALGYTPIEFEMFGVNPRHRPSLTEEAVDIMRLAWTGQPFSYSGKRYRVPEITLSPVPSRPPRILIGATVEAAIARAARIGDGFISAYNHTIETYESELIAQNRTGKVFAGQQAIITEDPDRAIAEHGAYALAHCNGLIDRGYADPATRERAHFTSLREAVDAGAYTLWDGPTAVDEIVRLIERHPLIEDVSFMVNSGPGEPLSLTQERVHYLADYVLPRVKQTLAQGSRASTGRAI